MFIRKSTTITIDGIDLLLKELPQSAAVQVETASDTAQKVRTLFKAGVFKPDGSAFFASDAEIDDLPASVAKQLLTALGTLNNPKS